MPPPFSGKDSTVLKFMDIKNKKQEILYGNKLFLLLQSCL